MYSSTKVKISTLMRSGNVKKNRERLAVARSISVAKEQHVPVDKLYTIDVLIRAQALTFSLKFLSINPLASYWHILSLFSPILSPRWLEMQMIVRTDFAFT